MSKKAATATERPERLGALDDHRDALAAPDAEGRRAEVRVAVLHRVQQRDEDPGAARTDRVAEGDRTAVDVHAVLRDAELAEDAEGLCGERLVQLPEVDLLAPEAGALERLLRGRPRSHSHDRRIDARGRVGADLRERREAEILRLLLRHDDDRRRAVVDARRVAGGHAAAVLLERRTERGEALRGRVAARVLVGLELDGLALLRRDLDRHDLGL